MKATVLYDGQCGLCLVSVARLRRLDWLGHLAYADARDPDVLAAHPNMNPDRALERLHVVVPANSTRGSALLDGFRAIRWMAGRLPALWILWPLLWLPGMTGIGTRMYDRIARNRFLFGSCAATDRAATDRAA